MDINIINSKVVVFPFEEENESKAWSYSSVYSLIDLRNIYMLCWRYNGFPSTSKCLEACIENGITSESGKRWTNRNVLEILNALINFLLLERRSLIPVDVNVKFETFGEEFLSNKDKKVLLNIFFHYKRFAEFWNLFEKSSEKGLICSFNYLSRFTDSFLMGITDDCMIYRIPERKSEIMRFWDVFCSWGVKLGVLEKVPLHFFNIDTVPSVKGLSLIYKTHIMPHDFSILNYYNMNHLGRNVYIPVLFIHLIKDYKFSIEFMKKKLVEEVLASMDSYRLQSTSLIFVDRNDEKYLPKVDNVYMSHLLKF